MLVFKFRLRCLFLSALCNASAGPVVSHQRMRCHVGTTIKATSIEWGRSWSNDNHNFLFGACQWYVRDAEFVSKSNFMRQWDRDERVQRSRPKNRKEEIRTIVFEAFRSEAIIQTRTSTICLILMSLYCLLYRLECCHIESRMRRAIDLVRGTTCVRVCVDMNSSTCPSAEPEKDSIHTTSSHRQQSYAHQSLVLATGKQRRHTLLKFHCNHGKGKDSYFVGRYWSRRCW